MKVSPLDAVSQYSGTAHSTDGAYQINSTSKGLRKDIDLLEKFQRRATWMMVDMRGDNYEEWLRKLNLTTLETRRLSADLIEVFKIMKGFDNVDSSKFFILSGFNFRNHTFKLFKRRFIINIHKYNFSNRVVDFWNKLD